MALNDAAVADIHEKYGPAYLTHHRVRGVDRTKRSYSIELPIPALASLSALPAFAAHRWGFEGPPRNIKVLTKYFDRSESAFLEENFGFLRTSFPMGGPGMPFPELYPSLSLITPEGLADRGSMKEVGAEYLTDEGAVLDRFAERNPGAVLLTLARISTFFSPYLSIHARGSFEGSSVVVGDTVDDRLLFWNGYQQTSGTDFGGVAILRLPATRIGDRNLVHRIARLLERRGARDLQGHEGAVTLRSCSVPQEQLEVLAGELRVGHRLLRVRIQRHDDHAACVPQVRNPERVGYSWGTFFDSIKSQATVESSGPRLMVPRPLPWHMREALPPAGLRSGSWMADLVIDRGVDHCPYSNQQHIWLLPRRLRLDRAFRLEGGDGGRHGSSVPVSRVSRSGLPSVTLWHGQESLALVTPDDTDAFRHALNPLFEWTTPFDIDRDRAPVQRSRFQYSEPSDKGRYLLGVLGRFATLPDAFHSLMHGFWHDVLLMLGGAPVERNTLVREELIKVLRRRLRQPIGDLRFSSAEDLDRLGSEALRVARKLRRDQRFIKYEELKAKWDHEVVVPFLGQHPPCREDDDGGYYSDEARLEAYVQHLCQHEVLFQGRAWQCRRCYNRNWVTVDNMQRTLTCEVCSNIEPAPVSAGWHFRPNAFVIEAYQDHGVEAVIFALWQLWERARQSFYFAPSLVLWLDRPVDRKNKGSDLEIDALAVVDGKLYLCEAKSSAALSAQEIGQLVLAAERIRPDVIAIACMEPATPALQRSVERLRARIAEDIQVEILDLRTDMLERMPYRTSRDDRAFITF